ncbi:MAG: ribonuclease E/G [Parasporobacterium sp.]|nr:ribonuclease E/G [Parasporobacterium sp.]
MSETKKGKLVITKKNQITFSLLLNSRGIATQINLDGGKGESAIGNIYIGRVDNIVKNINAAFIEYAPGMMGYYPLEEGSTPVFTNPGRKPGPMRKGDQMIVQVSKDALKSKDPVLTSDINLTGKYVVLTLAQKGLHFSNKFRDPEKKKQIQKDFEGFGYEEAGFIIRTNAMFADPSQIYEEMDFYYDLWLMLKDCGLYNNCLSQIYQAPPSYMVNIRDGYETILGEILTDDPEIYESLRGYLEKYQPDDLEKLKFYDHRTVSLHTMFNIDRQITEALQKKVWLKSGGYIIIEPTEALVSIDVNTGKYISEKKAEDEYLKVNLEAAAEIARQILLRNLSGIIIIDFINMKSEAYKTMLMDYLKSQLQFDPVKTNIVEMTKLNLVEITRKKIRKPIYELIDISMLQ